MSPKSFRLFSAQNYHILENDYANTAVRDGPMMNHYKRDRFVIQSSLPVFDQFSAGIAGWRDKQGTWKDAEDGRLEGNVVAHGTVDSAVAWTLPELPPGGAARVHFWACVGRSFRHARELHDWIRVQDIDLTFAAGGRYWNSFCARARSRGALARAGTLPADLREACARSLLAVAAHVDRGGSIIASCDSQIKQQGADYYTYCWPRDAAWVAIALDKAGYGDLCGNTFRFLARIIDRKGFFRHKYTPAGDLGSTWHPLPMLQVDETGLPLVAVYRHWLEGRNVMTISSLYEPFIRPAADFLAGFIDRGTGLPKPSFDLWEERKGVYTYSCACVYAGLAGAAALADVVGDRPSSLVWGEAARALKETIVAQLYDPALGRFLRGVGDDTVDASFIRGALLRPGPSRERRGPGDQEGRGGNAGTAQRRRRPLCGGPVPGPHEQLAALHALARPVAHPGRRPGQGVAAFTLACRPRGSRGPHAGAGGRPGQAGLSAAAGLVPLDVPARRDRIPRGDRPAAPDMSLKGRGRPISFCQYYIESPKGHYASPVAAGEGRFTP